MVWGVVGGGGAGVVRGVVVGEGGAKLVAEAGCKGEVGG